MIKKKRDIDREVNKNLDGIYCLSTSRNKSKSRVANFFICAFYFMFAILFILSHCLIHQKKPSIPAISYNIGTRKIYWSWFMKWLGDQFIFTSTCIAVQTILFTTQAKRYRLVSNQLLTFSFYCFEINTY